MLGKKLINSGPSGGGGGANTFASENFNTVLYTGNGSTQRIGGYINRGAVFNGSSSYIAVDRNVLVNNNWTLSLWVNIGSVTPYINFRIYDSSLGDYAGKLRLGVNTNGTINAGQGNSTNSESGFSSTGTINDGNWHNLVVTFDGTTTKLYIDNTLDGTDTPANFSDVSGNATIGAGNIPSQPNSFKSYLGKIDQVRFFNKALSSSEVTTLYGETFASASKSVTDIFNDNSAVALYQLDGNANDTGGLDYVFTTWDSTLSSVPNYSEGNLRMTGGSGNKIGYSVDSVSSGKWYWEHEVIAIGAESSFGIARPGDLGSHYVVGTTSTSWGLYVNGNSYHNGSVSTSGYMSGGFSNGDIIGVELDLDNGTIEFYKNGTGYGNAFTGLSGEFLVAAEARTSSGINDHRTNFGATAWDYTPSTGFAGINTEYNGTASNVTYQEATNFSPDLVIVKSRNTGEPFMWRDSVRGGNATRLFSDRTAISSVFTPDSISSFDSNGFTCGGNGGRINSSSNNYVAWCFNAGEDAPATNTDGTISSTVKANPEAGFSIVTFTSSNSTVQPPPMNYMGHGLDAAPEMVIYKRLDASQNWIVQHDGVTTNGALYLDLTNAQNGPFTYDFFDNTTTTIGVRSNYAITRNASYIAYNFHSVDGYQKVGSYTGSSSDVLVETGFEPAWVMVKNTTNAYSWYVIDNKRGATTSSSIGLFANLTNAEAAGYGIHFQSNGFTVSSGVGTGTNAANNNYIYLAIAADPDTTTPTVENSFDVVTYSGSSTSGTGQTIQFDFNPDLVITKSRTSNTSWAAMDTVRGAGSKLRLNLTSAELDNTYGGIQSFNGDGSVTFEGTSDTGDVDYTGRNYVAYAWKAGEHDDNLPQINTEGSIDSIVSVNDAAGFSIVKWTGTGANATIGHGLSSAPEMIITKNTDDSAENWNCWHTGLSGNGYRIMLNQSSPEDGTSPTVWNNNINPTSTTFSLGSAAAANGLSDTIIAYCFTSIAGYQKIDSYSGTGSAGNAQNVGFAPRFVLVKRTTANESWFIFDTARPDKRLEADSSNTESTDVRLNLTSTGFDFDGNVFNESSNTYIYLAIK